MGTQNMKTYYVEYTRKIMKLERPTVLKVEAETPEDAVRQAAEFLKRDSLYEVVGIVAGYSV